MYVCMYVYMYACMYVYMYARMHVYMYACMHTCTRTLSKVVVIHSGKEGLGFRV